MPRLVFLLLSWCSWKQGLSELDKDCVDNGFVLSERHREVGVEEIKPTHGIRPSLRRKFPSKRLQPELSPLLRRKFANTNSNLLQK